MEESTQRELENLFLEVAENYHRATEAMLKIITILKAEPDANLPENKGKLDELVARFNEMKSTMPQINQN